MNEEITEQHSITVGLARVDGVQFVCVTSADEDGAISVCLTSDDAFAVSEALRIFAKLTDVDEVDE